jgi:hypothetical protein
MIIAVLLAALAGCGVWAWWHQARALRMLRMRTSVVPRPGDEAVAPVIEGAPLDAVGAESPVDEGAARVSVRQLERAVPRPPTSVLGWEAFSIVSALALDGTALIGCRREPVEDWGVPDWRREGRPSDRTSEVGTLVLLIGDDQRAMQAVALLDDWRLAETNLILRPTVVSGAIELFDGRNRALRACLLAG